MNLRQEGQMPDFSDKSIRMVFDARIDKSVSIRPDRWKGCNPLAQDYQVDQLLSKKRA